VPDEPSPTRRDVTPWWRKLTVVVPLVLVSVYAALLVVKAVSPAPSPEAVVARATNTARAYADAASTPALRDEVRPDLGKLHSALRAHLLALKTTQPTGLDPVLSRLLERVDYRVGFVTTSRTIDKSSFAEVATKLAAPGGEVAPIADMLDSDYSCADGLTEGMTDLTTSDVITFAQERDLQPQVRVRWKLRASGEGYVMPASPRIFPGIVIAGDLELFDGERRLLSMPFEVTPGKTIDFTSSATSVFFKTGRDADVAAGLIRGACRQLGTTLAETLVGWTLPVKPPPGLEEKVRDCTVRAYGHACFEVGTALRDGKGVPADPARALELFSAGCGSGALESGPCCVAAAELLQTLAKPGDGDAGMEATARSTIMLGTGCDAHYAEACTALGVLELRLYPGETAPSQYAVGQAMRPLVRACDLGWKEGCARAATLLANPGPDGEPSFAGAAVLSRRVCKNSKACPDAARFEQRAVSDKSVFGTPLGKDHVFDVRWGDWFEIDSGRVVAWVASDSDPDSVGARLGGAVGKGTARVYSPSELPFGPKAPPGAKSVWAVIAGEPTFKDDRRCRECKTGEASDPMLSAGCVCLPLALAK
jgi:hypothetical protein